MSKDRTAPRRKPCSWAQFESSAEDFVELQWPDEVRWALVRGPRRLPGQVHLRTMAPAPGWLEAALEDGVRGAVAEAATEEGLVPDEACAVKSAVHGEGSRSLELHLSVVWHATFESPALFVGISDAEGRPAPLSAASRTLGERLSCGSAASRFGSATLEVRASCPRPQRPTPTRAPPQEHPVTGLTSIMVHPCQTQEWMALLDGDGGVRQPRRRPHRRLTPSSLSSAAAWTTASLLIWYGVVAAAVGIPLSAAQFKTALQSTGAGARVGVGDGGDDDRGGGDGDGE